VRVDRGQLEQVLMNLAVNARDAMPTGGRLTIATAPEELDADEAAALGLEPGAYVRITVADTGHGMDEETRRRAFEPFFTTKAPGEGTGLGLATVHGIVHQSGGRVDVESAAGAGATFRILLPATDDLVTTEAERPAPPVPARAETALLVEDEAVVRRLARIALERSGYHVLEAASADEAEGVLSAHDGHVHILVTDVVMPGRSGIELARRVAEQRPSTRVLFMSGYTEELVDPQAAFLPKPFTPDTIALKVREVLDAG
jgi:CheY-like chemotaxis protein